jgi:uncharacterized cupredoxin-like copper-binding protein
MATRVLATLAAAAVVTCVGCGEERPAGGGAVRTTPVTVGEPQTPIGRAVASIDVSLSEYSLLPSQARAARAGVVAFVATNDGQERHALQVDGPAGEERSAQLRPGERTTLGVRLPPGTYKWLCPLADHEQRGMSGRIRVAE